MTHVSTQAICTTDQTSDATATCTCRRCTEMAASGARPNALAFLALIPMLGICALAALGLLTSGDDAVRFVGSTMDGMLDLLMASASFSGI